ncbi:unnamed protein product [Toxocara canis]|uniref:RNA polymerase II subunit A C-terminal domain phosphatase n=1 Tax=Toxocara canis TaxID=6265 RepID=A0A183UV47_TOXCA|nr:unnamed protein product [Toxocara canis]
MVVARIDECRHAIVIKDMCGSCGKDLREKDGMAGQRVEPSLANVSMIHHVPELIVSDELAKKIGDRDQQLVLESRRLVLLVDLDQTLIHTTNHSFEMKDSVDVVHYKLRGTDFYTKIRPYARTFLRRMNELYEMHIISYGERQYAHKIAEILDPDKRYFGHRILSRDELFSAMYKTGNMKALFPCGDQLIAIIDDRPDVWQYSDALIQVKPYRFFKEIGDINAPAITNVQEQSLVQERIAQVNVEGDGDETLEYVATDLKHVIAYMRSQVLRGCCIVLSGIVPIGMDVRNTEAFHLCVQFGATVTESVTDSTTHVIAARWGTTKVHDARKRPNVAIVNPRWLYACVERWEKADEKDFELTRETMNSKEKPLGGLVIDRQLSNMPTFAKETLKNMTDEVPLISMKSDVQRVDEVLSEDDSDSEQKEEMREKDGERKRRSNAEEKRGEKRERKNVEEDGGSSSSETSDPDVETMAADLEREFT